MIIASTEMSRRRSEDDTVPFAVQAAGNDLFHRALFAIGMHGTAVTSVLGTTMRAIGATPAKLTIVELAAMLPEIERRLRLLAPHDVATSCVARLRKLVLEWEP